MVILTPSMSQGSHAMNTFFTRHEEQVKGTLSGFDRVRFRGTLRWLANLKGMNTWLCHANILLKDFKDYAMGLTNRLKLATQELAAQAERPVHYLASSSLRKEDFAKAIAEQDGITE